jgi:acyl-CoA thioester hydrolase
MVYGYRIVRQSDGHLLATGETQNVFTHKATGKVARLGPEPYAKLLALYEKDQAAQ